MRCHSYHSVRLLLIVSSFVMSACSSNDEAGASNVGNTDAGTFDVRDEGKAGSSGSVGAAGKGGSGGGGAGQGGVAGGMAGTAGIGGGSDEAGVGDSGRGGGTGSPCDVSKIDCSNPACAEYASGCPGGEVCDGEDNDGDSRIGEGNVCGPVGPDCPPGAIQLCDCFGGVHRQCKADGTWGPCIVDSAKDPYGTPCGTPADCKAPYDSCETATHTCVNPQTCATAVVWTQAACNSPEICDFGRCADYTGTGMHLGTECLHHADCSGGKICDIGHCVPDPYPRLPCFE